MPKVVQIHPNDNVAVALETIDSQVIVQVGDISVEVCEGIPRGHKLALRRIHKSSIVKKYGWPIGVASARIEPGSWVHTHNLESSLKGLCNYRYEPKVNILRKQPTQVGGCPPEFLGFRRPSGRVGVRNEIWILVTVGCVSATAQNLAKLATARFVGKPIEGIYAFTHPFGCGQFDQDLLNTQELLASLVGHPNCGGVLILGLGCETNALRAQIEKAGILDNRAVRFFNTQDVQDEVESGMSALEDLIEYASTFRREKCPISDLVVGLKCGGSDGFSGITANPLVGRITERIVGWGGAAVLSEVPEMFGAEEILMSRCHDEATYEATIRMINSFKHYLIENHQPICENPAPGNKKGGITTLEEKSLGCIQKGGNTVVTQVLEYGKKVTAKGLVLLAAPGNDLVSSTALVASGAQILLFTTGRGTPLGTPVPTIKIASNSTLAERKPNWVDFDAGRLLNENVTSAELEAELMCLVMDTVSGNALARNEITGMRDIAVFKTGVTV
jgi:altronate hydrolase